MLQLPDHEKRIFPPTEEQVAILDACRSTSDNLLIGALAGAAKTSTLVRIAAALPSTPIMCLAFNKRIATEMKERLSSNCSAKTLNGLGHQIWWQSLGKKLTIEEDKMYNILSFLVDELQGQQKSEAFTLFSETLKACKEAKTAGYIPKVFGNEKRLMTEADLFAWMDEEPTALQEDLIIKASTISARQAFEGRIDFNDQILLPVVYPVSFEKFSPPLIMVDEAQDLSALNHAMLRKLVRRRLIAVGDPRQAIYGFRGAHENSMELLREVFSMQEYALTMTFRCAKSIVEEARWRAPAITCPETAQEGSVTHHLSKWDEDLLPRNAAVICRNNAPLFALALRLMKAGRMPQILGADIGKGLLKVMKKLGGDATTSADAETILNEWANEKLGKSRDPSRIHDQVECIRVFLDQAPTLSGAIAFAQHLFSSEGPIKLMTGHKSKGLEFDHVFILDRGLIRMNQDQDRNLLYVMQTRAKLTLTYVNLEDFQ